MDIRYVDLGLKDLVTYFRPGEEIGFYALMRVAGEDVKGDISIPYVGKYSVEVMNETFVFDDPMFLSGMIRALNYLGVNPWEEIQGDDLPLPDIYPALPHRFKFSAPSPETLSERDYDFEVIVPLREDEIDGFIIGVKTSIGVNLPGVDDDYIIGTSNADLYYSDINADLIREYVLHSPPVGDVRTVVTFDNPSFFRGYLKALIALQVNWDHIINDEALLPDILPSMVSNYIELIIPSGYEVERPKKIRIIYRVDVSGKSSYLSLTSEELNGLIISVDDLGSPSDVRLYEGKDYPELPIIIRTSSYIRRVKYLTPDGKYSLLGPHGYYNFDDADFFKGYVSGAELLGETADRFRVIRRENPDILITNELLQT